MVQEDPVFHALCAYTKALSVALGYRDLMTQLHSERVRELSVAIGVAFGLSKARLTHKSEIKSTILELNAIAQTPIAHEKRWANS